MPQGRIIRAISGFYYVSHQGAEYACKARGHFRHEGVTPLVGDEVRFTALGGGAGALEEILPRKNAFQRPSVANIDLMVILVSAAIPVTDPFLADRMTVLCERAGCEPLICVNKSDLAPGERLRDIYLSAGYPVVMCSALTGEGVEELRRLIRGRVCAFTGNSGVGKSSVLNRLDARFQIKVGEVSDKLGRGRHTTRHVELFDLGGGTFAADTPGFSAFDTDQADPIRRDELQGLFPEFAPYIGSCRFDDCVHINEPGCAVREALAAGDVHESRYASYVRLCAEAAKIKEWELKA